ncbi:MAG: AMP-binding protein [Kiritimatiellae bacterium]|nr:AMP-binding protein [Kiritimatiellia bacterium]
MTIRDFFDNTVARYPQRPVQVFFRGGKWTTRTYDDFRARVMRASEAIRRIGVEPARHNVALILENCPEWQEIYLALACIGMTVVPIDPKLRPREVSHILRDSGAAAVIAGAKQFDALGQVVAELPLVGKCICVNQGAPSAVGDGLLDYETLIADTASDAAAADWKATAKPVDDTVASLIYTSGTTGSPKGVMLTHGNFAADALAAAEAVNFNKDDNFLAVLPFFHTYSFTGNFLLPLCQGACTSFARSIKTISDDMRTLRPSVLLAVPLLVEKIYAKVNKGIRENLAARLMLATGFGKTIGRKVINSLGGRLRLIAIGGAPADRQVLKGLDRLGIPTLEGYGLTECAPLVAYPTLGNFRIGTVGKILPCMEYKVIDKDETGAGELCVRGPNVMRGYYHNQEATSAAIDADGYLHTGDVVRVDKAGNIAICGRRKAMVVNREGKNIYPEEIEQVVCRSPYVAEALALGYKVPGETGERVGLVVQADEDACAALGETAEARDAALLAEVKRLCNEGLADYKVPRKISIRHEAFELTSTMKVRRAAYAGSLDEKA